MLFIFLNLAKRIIASNESHLEDQLKGNCGYESYEENLVIRVTGISENQTQR